MNFETIFKEKIELEKLVVALTRENMELKQRYNCNSGADQLFADYILTWLQNTKLKVKQNTYDAYVCQVYGHIEPYFRAKGLKLSDITPLVLENYYHDKYLSGLCGATLKKHHSNIRMSLKSAVKNGIIPYNPADSADTLPMKKYVGIALTQNQLEKLLEYIKINKPRIYLPVFIAISMGLRRSEVLGLRWSDIDFDAGVLHIQHTAVKSMKDHHTEIIFSDIPKTKSSRRTLPLPEKIYEYLKHIKGKQRIFYAKNRKNYCKEYLKYICVDNLGNFITPNYLSAQFKEAVENCNIKCRFHDLRHTCASLLIQNGVPLKSVSQWLGHSSINVTSEVYIHLTFQDKVKVAEEIEKILFDRSEK